MPRFDDIEEVIICELVPEAEAACCLPCIYPRLIEIEGRVTFDVREGGELAEMVGCGEEILVIFGSSEKGEEVFFELQSDEFLGPKVAVRARPRWIFIVPGLVDCLRKEIDPPSVGRGKGKGGPKGGRSDRYGRFI